RRSSLAVAVRVLSSPPLILARSGDPGDSSGPRLIPSAVGRMGSRDGGRTGGQGYAADIDSIREARARIAPYVHRTPVLSSTSIDAIAGKQLFFKCECFQKAGAFKIRGASNSIFAQLLLMMSRHRRAW
ncbi:unnamed protein product, partial [Urochloa humidicola]